MRELAALRMVWATAAWMAVEDVEGRSDVVREEASGDARASPYRVSSVAPGWPAGVGNAPPTMTSNWRQDWRTQSEAPANRGPDSQNNCVFVATLILRTVLVLDAFHTL